MIDAPSLIAPPDFENWPQDRKNEWAAEGARRYRESQKAESPPRSYRVAEAAKQPEAPPPEVMLVQGSSITPKPINWLWEGWLAAGKFHVLGGAPGAGKTTIAGDFAAILTRGGQWPDGTRAPAGNVVIWSGEDDPHDTLTPRLIAAGADMARVFFVGDVREASKARAFDPARDIESLRGAIASKGASLLIVDPLVSAVAGDSHKSAEVRRALQPLADLASEAGTSLLGITHFSKGTAGREPLERITGSLAFGALARIVLVAAKRPADSDDDAPSRVLMRAKSNIGPDGGGFEYELRQHDLEAHPGIEASRVEWGAAIEGTAREILGEAESAGQRDDGGAVTNAAIFLRATLADGPMAVSELKASAEGAGLSWISVRRAKDALGVLAKKSGYGAGGGWEWSLPTP